MDVFATPPIEGSTVRILYHATNVALRFVETTFAEVLVDGVRVMGVIHLLQEKGIQTANASKTGIPRDFHRAGQVGGLSS
jgi:hypothetical protein